MMLFLCVAVLILDVVFAAEYSITPKGNEDILAISTTTSEIAIGYSEIIRLYVIGDIVEIGNVSLPEHISTDPGFLEFKLISSREVAYCGSNSCGYCSFYDAKPFCKKLSLFYNMQTSQGLKSASITAINGNIFLRLVDETNRAAILVYNIHSKGYVQLTVIQYSMDIDRISNQHTVASFSRGDYVYFVGSELQSYDPLINAHMPLNDNQRNYTVVKMTRICATDNSAVLASRMDLHIGCEERSTAGPSHYDPWKQHVWQVARQDNGYQNICWHDMPTIEKRFEKTWNTCNTKYSGEIDDCTNKDDIKYLKDHCFILNRRSRGNLDSCITPNRTYVPPVNNCEIEKISQSEIPYGSLEEFKMYEGNGLTKYGSLMDGFTSIFPVNFYKNAILARQKGNYRNIYWVSLANSEIFAEVLIGDFALPESKNNIAISEDYLFFINGTRVYGVPVTCEGLYKTCEFAIKEGSKSPGRCAWCADETFQAAISLNDKATCKRILTKMCPPTIQLAIRSNTNRNDIFGTNFNNIVNGTIHVCEELCPIKAELSDDRSLVCFLNKSIAKDVICEVRLTFKLENFENYTVIAQTSMHPTTDIPPNPKPSNTHSAIKAIIVICMLLILLGASYLVFTRCKSIQPKRPNVLGRCTGEIFDSPLLTSSDSQADPNSTDGNVNMQALEIAHRNSITTANLYGRTTDQSGYAGLFHNIEPCNKIDFSELNIDIEIGHGYFGVVKRASYKNAGGISKSVACKMLKEGVPGIREFFTEGLTMGKFKHPHVIDLIGIAFTDNKIPVIITDYMANGDLLTFLKKTDTAPSVSRLLQFALEIARGMEYLHSMKIMHRDLAARNCMLDVDLTVKIADFGLARACSEDSAYLPSTNRELPIAWMPIEALQKQTFTTKGDVWSYGAVLWELITLGKSTPYEHVFDLLIFLKDGHRLSIPSLYTEVMVPCWHEDMEERPTFAALVYLVKVIMKKTPVDGKEE